MTVIPDVSFCWRKRTIRQSFYPLTLESALWTATTWQISSALSDWLVGCFWQNSVSNVIFYFKQPFSCQRTRAQPGGVRAHNWRFCSCIMLSISKDWEKEHPSWRQSLRGESPIIHQCPIKYRQTRTKKFKSKTKANREFVQTNGSCFLCVPPTF